MNVPDNLQVGASSKFTMKKLLEGTYHAGVANDDNRNPAKNDTRTMLS